MSYDYDYEESAIPGPSSSSRSTAALFFEKDEESANPASSTYDIVVELLNNAAVIPKSADKIANLRKAQELIVHKSSDLLDNFLDEMLAFQSDSSKDVKRFVIGFMEEACKKDFECLPKVMPSLVMLLGDDDINVQKKVILIVSNLFKLTLMWISKAKQTRAEMKEVWIHLSEVKNLMYELLESVNDGIRTHVVKFLEGLTLTMSKRTQDSEIPKKNADDFTIENLPENNGIVQLSDLEDEGRKAFTTMLQFQGSPHVSSINLMTVMNSLANVAKQRPEFFDQVVQSYEALHVNLPPTLAKSQVSSVRKNLKTQMMGLLKQPASLDFLPQISTLLTDLGASQSEISKNTPKEPESRKRKAFKEPLGFGSKKAKVEVDEDDDMTPWVDRTSKKPKADPIQKQTAIDVTANDIKPRLTTQNVTDLVLLSMVMLPDTMPALFESTYTPVAAAGTETQISHIARLLATQITMAGMGKGLGELQMQTRKQSEAVPEITDDDQPASPRQLIQTVVGLKTEEEQLLQAKKLKMSQLPMPPTARKNKFQLSQVTQPLEDTGLEALAKQSVDRILQAEKAAVMGQVEHHRTKLLVSLSSFFGQSVKDSVMGFIFNDLRNREDLIFSWLYQEYANSQSYNSGRSKDLTDTNNYSECLSALLVELMDNEDHHSDMMFHRVLLEAPLITDFAVNIINKYCSIPEHTEAGMKTLSQLIQNRPAHRSKFLNILLTFTAHQSQEVRNIAIKAVQSLHTSGKMQSEIEEYANQQLNKLLLPKPPAPPDTNAPEVPETWTEEKIKAHLYLHLGLLPSHHKLIHELASVYTATSADIKRTILRILEPPVKGMGMDSPELLTLLENCPKGSETLVMRVIHILTDKAVPSPQLVERIRDLYHKRVPDVRFLIPVLNGLSKVEVMEALPKLIKLNPMVVKEVFNRLMGSHVTNESQYQSPLTPVELLVALHNIDPAKCDIKTTIKAANLCFAEKLTYTQEVLPLVIQQLMEQNPLPTLLMRTVLQSLSMYPQLDGFVLSVLKRLITKKVWKQKKVWEGFIRCCQRVKPKSFQLLLQLPPSQLRDVFEICPDLKEPLLSHVQEFTENQKAYINKAVMSILEECREKEEQKSVEGDQNTEPESTEVTRLGTSTENNAISNLTAVKTVETIDRSNTEKPLSKEERPEGKDDIENNVERDQSKQRERSREKEGSREKDRRRERGESKEKERGREGGSNRDRGKDRDSNRERGREKDKYRDVEKEIKKEKDRDRDDSREREKRRREWEGSEEREKRGRERERSREKERSKDRDRESGRERARSKEKERVRDKERGRSTAGEKEKSKDKSSVKDGERERNENDRTEVESQDLEIKIKEEKISMDDE